jgi:hypothetical protein
LARARDAHGTRIADVRDLVRQTDPPTNVLRRWIVPACEALGLKRVSWLTLRRTYSSWAHEKGVPGKAIAQLMGHAKVDTTLNVYTQVVDGSLRRAADTVGSEHRRVGRVTRGPLTKFGLVGPSKVWLPARVRQQGSRRSPRHRNACHVFPDHFGSQTLSAVDSRCVASDLAGAH